MSGPPPTQDTKFFDGQPIVSIANQMPANVGHNQSAPQYKNAPMVGQQFQMNPNPNQPMPNMQPMNTMNPPTPQMMPSPSGYAPSPSPHAMMPSPHSNMIRPSGSMGAPSPQSISLNTPGL